mgnify:CR=1 FL=1
MAMSVSRAGREPAAGVPDPQQVKDLLRGPAIPRGALNEKSRGLPPRRTAAGGPCPECGHAQSKHNPRGGCMAEKKGQGKSGLPAACPCTRMFRSAARWLVADESDDPSKRPPSGSQFGPGGQGTNGRAPATGVPQGNPQPPGGGALNTNPGLFDPATGIQAPALAPAGSPSSAVPAGASPGLVPSSSSDNVPAADPPSAAAASPTSPSSGSSPSSPSSSSAPTPDSGNNNQTRRDELGLGSGAFNGGDAAMSVISPLVNTGIGMASGIASGLGSGIGSAISGIGSGIGSAIGSGLGNLLSHRTAAAVGDYYRSGRWDQ